MGSLGFVGAACAWGSLDPALEKGPEALRCSSFLEELHLSGLDASWASMVHLGKKLGDLEFSSPQDAAPLIAEYNRRLIVILDDLMKQGIFPVVMGGDHSISPGTWEAVSKHFRVRSEEMGLLWISPDLCACCESSPPQDRNLNGQAENLKEKPLREQALSSLLGHSKGLLPPGLSGEGILFPSKTVLIGSQKGTTAEEKLVKETFGIRVFSMEEIEKVGLPMVLNEALSIVTHETGGFGLSADMRFFTGRKKYIDDLRIISENPHFSALEIVEFSNAEVKNHLIQDVLRAILAPKETYALLKKSSTVKEGGTIHDAQGKSDT